MDLFYREFGEAGNPQMVILHGLMGSSRNWQAAAADLGAKYHVFCLDLRNHGESPHVAPHSYDGMAEDVLDWMASHSVTKPILMGHSMGGKLAMKLACENPEKIGSLIVVDIAPKTYPNSHDTEYVAMRKVDMVSLKSRTEAARLLEEDIDDWAMRQFLVTNIVRDKQTGGYRWQINLGELESNQRSIEASSLEDGQCYLGEVMFVVGGMSAYFKDGDEPIVRKHFPKAEIKTIVESGHNPHFERREEFVSLVNEFVGP
ncbi:alpha/beta fold hydrolase [Puniceicoccaceae bacterium K14]|nr:alpha/beta fold hydrolase [Puniceicoccaceae bacterium K14]